MAPKSIKNKIPLTWLLVEYDSDGTRSILRHTDIELPEDQEEDWLRQLKKGDCVVVKWQATANSQLVLTEANVLMIGADRPELVRQQKLDEKMNSKRGELYSDSNKRARVPLKKGLMPKGTQDSSSSDDEGPETSKKIKNQINAADRQTRAKKAERDGNKNFYEDALEEIQQGRKQPDPLSESSHQEEAHDHEQSLVTLTTREQNTFAHFTDGKLQKALKEEKDKNKELLKELEQLNGAKIKLTSANAVIEKLTEEIEELKMNASKDQGIAAKISPYCVICSSNAPQLRAIKESIDDLSRHMNCLKFTQPVENIQIEFVDLNTEVNASLKISPGSSGNETEDTFFDELDPLNESIQGSLVSMDEENLDPEDNAESVKEPKPPSAPAPPPIGEQRALSDVNGTPSAAGNQKTKRKSLAYRNPEAPLKLTLAEFLSRVDQLTQNPDDQLLYGRNLSGQDICVFNNHRSGFMIGKTTMIKIEGSDNLRVKQPSVSMKLRDILLAMLNKSILFYLAYEGEEKPRGSNKVRLAALHPELKNVVGEFLKINPDSAKEKALMTKRLAEEKANVYLSDLP